MRFYAGLLALFVVITAVFLAVLTVVPTAARGWHAVAVTSGSMEPSIAAGDIVVAEPNDGSALAAGTVVVFRDPSRPGLVTHRIVRRRDDGSYVTAGDANRVVDSTPLRQDQVVGVGRLLVPMAGLPVVWSRTGEWHKVALAGLALAVALWLARFALFDSYDPWQGERTGPPPRSEPPAPMGNHRRLWRLRRRTALPPLVAEVTVSPAATRARLIAATANGPNSGAAAAGMRLATDSYDGTFRVLDHERVPRPQDRGGRRRGRRRRGDEGLSGLHVGAQRPHRQGRSGEPAAHPQGPGRVSRWRKRMRTAHGESLASRAGVSSVILSVVFAVAGVVGWTSAAFSSAAGNGANNWSTGTLAPPSGFAVVQTCGGLSDTITFRDANSGTGTGGVLTLARPGGTVAGDLLIAQVANRGEISLSTKPAGWTEVRTDTSASVVTSTIYWMVATASEPADYTWATGTNVQTVGGIAAYDGVSMTSPINNHGAQASYSSTATTPQLTTTVTNTRLVHFMVKRQEALPAPSGTTLRWSLISGGGANSAGATDADEAFVGPGTTPARSASASTFGSEWVAQTVALRPESTAIPGASASWTATPSTFATGYKLRRYVGAALQNEQLITPRTNTTATDSPLVNGTTYTYKLVAYYSNWSSSELTATLTPGC